MWGYLPKIPELGRLSQEDYEFQASLRYAAIPCFKKKKGKRKKDFTNGKKFQKKWLSDFKTSAPTKSATNA
jgi:hypothetical protein